MSLPLGDRTKKELSDLARRKGVPGWEAMTKEALVKALSAGAKPAAKAAAKPAPKPAARPDPKPVAGKPLPKPAAAKVTAKPAPPPTVNTNGKHLNGHAAGPAARPTAAPTPTATTRAVPAVKPTPPPPAKTAVPAAKAGKSSRPVEPLIPAEKNLASKAARAGTPVKDQIMLTVPDPFWLHAYWQLSVQSIQRAEAALAQDWHGAKPILRLFDVTSADTTSTSEAPLKDIPVHGGCSHWYIDVPQPPRSYRVEIGYITRGGRFFPLSRSNTVTPPKAGASEQLDENWTAEVDEKVTDRLLAAAAAADAGSTGKDLEDPFRKPGKDTPFGSGAILPGKLKKFFFEIDAQLIVVGRTDPTATVTLGNDPIKLAPDGTFATRYSLPDSRQIIPAVATSADGMEEQTIVLAVERNTKRLDPMIHDLYADP